MTIDEAIRHAEEVAEYNERQARLWDSGHRAIKGSGIKHRRCLECASEHRQLADWLKALKEIWDSGDCNDCLHARNCTIRPKLGQMVRYNCYHYERRIDEVNADE